MSATEIGIAVVERNGQYLVGTRGPDGPLAGYDEFPGGKCRANETPRECCVRECAEETGLLVRSVRQIDDVEFLYEHGNVRLHFWRCELVESNDVIQPHGNYRWVDRESLESLVFPEANGPVIERLRVES
ncbi:MAG: (deoxy)nucleoside triphosphate pyrophosphohydrolase [Planctomycetota bacterium]|nr:(deoxy)nucleoside triphosphate pyrophosphohydrolase [Planctomycetota bacterium]